MSTDKSLSLRLKIWLGVGFGAFVLAGCVIIIGALLVFDKFFPFDEKRQNEIAQSIVKIDKLPTGFDRIMASKIGNALVVEYKNAPSTLDIKLFRTLGSPTNMSAEQLLAQTTTISKDTPLEKKAIGNEELVYKYQDITMTTSSKFQGYIVPKNTKEAIHIESVYSGTPYKMQEMDKFLNSISGF